MHNTSGMRRSERASGGELFRSEAGYRRAMGHNTAIPIHAGSQKQTTGVMMHARKRSEKGSRAIQGRLQPQTPLGTLARRACRPRRALHALATRGRTLPAWSRRRSSNSKARGQGRRSTDGGVFSKSLAAGVRGPGRAAPVAQDEYGIDRQLRLLTAPGRAGGAAGRRNASPARPTTSPPTPAAAIRTASRLARRSIRATSRARSRRSSGR